MKELIHRACEARKAAYAPYSGFQVGAAALGTDGRIYTGCNIENASYSLCNCAERTAIFKAVSEGCAAFAAIAVVAATKGPTAPCGACRQVIAEFQIPKIIIANTEGAQQVLSLEELLPYAFSKGDMEERNLHERKL